MIERPPVTTTETDLDAIRALAKTTNPPIRVLKNAEAFPELYGKSRVGGAVPADGQFIHQGEGNRKVRRRQRLFVGSKKWPDGLVCGLTDSQHRRQSGMDDWADSSTQDDFSFVEMERLEALATGTVWRSQAEIIADSDAREAARSARASAPILTELQIAEAQGRAIGMAMAAAQAAKEDKAE